MSSEQFDEEISVVEKNKAKTKKARRFKVLLHNDDYTTMEFVISVLERIFFKTREEAKEIMLTVHEKGVGVCGVFVHEVAETKVKRLRFLLKERAST